MDKKILKVSDVRQMIPSQVVLCLILAEVVLLGDAEVGAMLLRWASNFTAGRFLCYPYTRF